MKNDDSKKYFNESYYLISSDFIDFNGHLTESGFYHYAILANVDIFMEFGLIEIFNSNKCAPVTFETNIKFKKQIFLNEKIKVRLNSNKITQRGEWERGFQIYNQDKILSAEILSSGRMFDQKTRKVGSPSEEVYINMKKFINSIS